jgi:transcriptional regulator with XRE-family HTH domain
MSPTSHREPISKAAAQALRRIAVEAGSTIRVERMRRKWPLRELAARAGISASQLQSIEAGAPASLETYARAMTALNQRPALVAQPAGRFQPKPDQDFVHAAMGELQARRLAAHGYQVAMDEPYQHFQFAGRADFVAWDLESRALLHIENRTQFPNVQDTLGSYSAKRAYLPGVLADRLGLGRVGWAQVSNVIVALWSAEVLHVLRLRRASFRAACPDPADDVLAWWAGDRPDPDAPSTSTLLLMDPGDVRERHRFATLEAAMSARPRYRDYADAAAALREDRTSLR